MNLVKRSFSYLSDHRSSIFVSVVALIVCFCQLSCQDQVYLPSADQLTDFENAGPVGPAVDLERIVRARISKGPYRVVAGEVIELTMPTILQIVTAEDPRVTANATPYVCRVSESGTITLPAVGEIEAAGKTLAEIEAAVVNAYYPTYAVTRPSVFAKILEYKTAKLSITGAVQKPGIYSLRSDQMSLVALLMEAGGIVEDGAATIRIIHSSAKQHDREIRDPSPVTRDPSDERRTETASSLVPRPPASAGASLSPRKRGSIVWRWRMDDRGWTSAQSAVKILDYTSFQGAGLRLSFVQLTPSGTTGLLTVKRDEKVVLLDLLDVSSNIQRRALSEKLAEQEPAVSTAQVERQLSLLAGQLEPAYNISASENGTILAKGAASSEQQIRTLSDEALEKLRDALSEVLKHEKSLREEGIAKLQEGENRDELGIVLPVKGLNIPFADVALDEGDTVIVEPLRVPVFSVIGLVNRPGNFPYPAQERYSLMQALAFAGGLDRDAEPRYATIYRLKADGTIASASFQVVGGTGFQPVGHGQDGRATALSIPIKPNDIVAVEHTQRTRTTVFLQRMFSIHVGAYVPVWR